MANTPIKSRDAADKVLNAAQDAMDVNEPRIEPGERRPRAQAALAVGVQRPSGLGNATLPTSLPWSLANRVSYLFNFNGPSLPVDTACSSSLTAIHLACESIRRGECRNAIAGGVKEPRGAV